MNEVPLFSIRGLSKNFPLSNIQDGNGVNRALEDVNLDIWEGECLLIAGSNGSGKTILMKIIAGLMDPSQGEVLFRGQSPAKAENCLRSSLGLVFQDADAQILGETVAEDTAFGPRNLGLNREQTAERVDRALKALAIEDKRDFPPRRLSGGEKRRLAVAGVIAMGCDTVIMDEPFANLDWPGVVHVLEIIRDLKAAGKTLIILTHELEKVLAFADRLVILHQGILREDGTPEEVLGRLKPEYGVRNPLQGYAKVWDCTWLE
ncbi:MAG: energy-coupling factor ABC transporter ATP-binding protein [Treponema sp.]|jgi:biotin transport system ATP-binding protein|nr:energy-coupling factor ABC transporter ATP-binding protein [Treponema sp.]